MFSPDDYDYALPAEQIAQEPPVDRRAARMLVALEGLRHAGIAELPALLAADPRRPLMVLNDSRVVPARVRLFRTDGRVFELLICEPEAAEPGTIVRAWVRGSKRLREGHRLSFGDVILDYIGRDPNDTRACRFN